MAKATQRPAARPVAPPAAKPAPRPAPRPPEKDSDFDPEATSVDFRTLGQLVRNQQNAQSLFEKEIVPDEAPIVDESPAPHAPDPHVAELSKWAAGEMESGAKEDARHPGAPKKKPLPPPPVPVAPPPEKSYAPLAIGLAAALVIACSILWFLLSGD
jgi:hypothetical protein